MSKIGKQIIRALKGFLTKLESGEEIPVTKLRYERLSGNRVKVITSKGASTIVRVAPDGSQPYLKELQHETDSHAADTGGDAPKV